MGYYSQVAIVFSKKEYDLFCEHITEGIKSKDFELKKALNSLSEEETSSLEVLNLVACAELYKKTSKSRNDEEFFAIYWPNIKWGWVRTRMSSEPSHEIMDYLNYVIQNDIEDDREIAFIRVGEDTGDVEKFGDMDLLTLFGLYETWGLDTSDLTQNPVTNNITSVYDDINSSIKNV